MIDAIGEAASEIRRVRVGAPDVSSSRGLGIGVILAVPLIAIAIAGGAGAASRDVFAGVCESAGCLEGLDAGSIDLVPDVAHSEGREQGDPQHLPWALGVITALVLFATTTILLLQRKVWRVMGTHSDITACKRVEAAEPQLADIIEFLPDATFVIDQHGRVIAWARW